MLGILPAAILHGADEARARRKGCGIFNPEALELGEAPLRQAPFCQAIASQLHPA
jgi:hypothetical protein